MSILKGRQQYGKMAGESVRNHQGVRSLLQGVLRNKEGKFAEFWTNIAINQITMVQLGSCAALLNQFMPNVYLIGFLIKGARVPCPVWVVACKIF